MAEHLASIFGTEKDRVNCESLADSDAQVLCHSYSLHSTHVTSSLTRHIAFIVFILMNKLTLFVGPAGPFYFKIG